MFVRLLVAAAAVMALVPSAFAAAATPEEAALLKEMNRVRVLHGLAPFRTDARLERAASWHTREMVTSGTFAHGAFWTRLRRFHVEGGMIGENLVWGAGPYGTPTALVAAWLASPGHRANLLRPAFRRVGLGVVVGTFDGYPGATVVTADFAG